MTIPTETPTHELVLPAGLSLRRRGEGIEGVQLKSGDVRLLAAGQGTEMVEIAIHKGEKLTLVPADEKPGRATEMYYLLEGRLGCKIEGRPAFIDPGDYLVAENISAPLLLIAASDVRVLYITSQPFFHEISQDMQDLMRLAVEVEVKDGYTADHCLRLQKLSVATGQELGLESHRLHLLDYGAYLHDVGKAKIPVEILQKPSALTPDEWQVIRQHPTFGRELLDPTFMKEAGSIVEQHHERLDGSGYPFGAAGKDVGTESYIVAVADTYDAMTTDRPYRAARGQDEAFEEIARFAGIHYPKDIVAAFFSAVKDRDF